MLRKPFMLCIALLLGTLAPYAPAPVASAQDSIELKPGEFAPGEFTDSVKEVKYTFSGKKDEQYCVTFDAAAKEMNKAASGSLTIKDAKGTALNSNSFSSAPCATLPADGSYSVSAEQKFSQKGPFVVQLHPVSRLAVGQKADAKILYRIAPNGNALVATPAHFLIQERSDFRLTVTPGETKFPTGYMMMTYFRVLSLTRSYGDTVVHVDGNKYAAVGVVLKGQPQAYRLVITFNGYSASGKALSSEEVFSQTYTIALEAAQP